jgi:hypothetical protein
VQVGAKIDWRDGAAYAPLLGADRSLFAWEWLRRDPDYRAAAQHSRDGRGGPVGHQAAAAFGLVAFEAPDLAVPRARPLWRAGIDSRVLAVERASGTPEDSFLLDRLRRFATLLVDGEGEHLLLSDGLRTIRLDAPEATFGCGPVCLRYRIVGLARAEPLVVTLRRLLALCRTRRFARSLHPLEVRAGRWVLMLRAWDGLVAGADQRDIAAVLLSRSAQDDRWRSRVPSLRARAQRLVKSARLTAGGGYRRLLA